MAIDGINANNLYPNYKLGNNYGQNQEIQRQAQRNPYVQRPETEIPSNPFVTETNAYANNQEFVARLDRMDANRPLDNPDCRTEEVGQRLYCMG